MEEVCSICGLPKELCVCGTIKRETERIKVRLELRRYNKPVTIIEGIDEGEKELQRIAKKLKAWNACGGSVKGGKIILQGDHREKVPEMLRKLGFDPNQIEVT